MAEPATLVATSQAVPPVLEGPPLRLGRTEALAAEDAALRERLLP